MLMKLTYALALTSIALTTTSAAQPVTDVSPAIHVGDMTFSGEKVLLRSADGVAGQLSCTLEGQAKVVLFSGDIEFTADRIQLELNGDFPVSIICSGSCRYKQTDANEFLSGNKLTLGEGGLRVTGNAILQFGTEKDMTVLSGDSIIAIDGKYEVLGKATLRRGR
ncbi:MAG: hypothetical protein VB878_18935 [Pirellulaceae bacterium]